MGATQEVGDFGGTEGMSYGGHQLHQSSALGRAPRCLNTSPYLCNPSSQQNWLESGCRSSLGLSPPFCFQSGQKYQQTSWSRDLPQLPKRLSPLCFAAECLGGVWHSLLPSKAIAQVQELWFAPPLCSAPAVLLDDRARVVLSQTSGTIREQGGLQMVLMLRAR